MDGAARAGAVGGRSVVYGRCGLLPLCRRFDLGVDRFLPDVAVEVAAIGKAGRHRAAVPVPAPAAEGDGGRARPVSSAWALPCRRCQPQLFLPVPRVREQRLTPVSAASTAVAAEP